MAKVLLVDVNLDFHGVGMRLKAGDSTGRADLLRVLQEMGVAMMDRAEFAAHKAQYPDLDIQSLIALLALEAAGPPQGPEPAKADADEAKQGDEQVEKVESMADPASDAPRAAKRKAKE